MADQNKSNKDGGQPDRGRNRDSNHSGNRNAQDGWRRKDEGGRKNIDTTNSGGPRKKS